jgi:pyruvate/2-oxoglutarate dehydrogenase complex dihydrolipoamide acyltransferase (E2) component
MPVEVKLPQLGMGMSAATITRWLKREGDSVSADEPIVEIEAEKTSAEVVAPVGGTITAIQAAEGDSVPVYEVIAVIEED